MERQILQTRAFQTAFGAPMPEKPTMLEKKRAQLRQRLLQEEVTELKKSEDLESVADAICDIMYITIGTAHEYGLSDRLSLMFDEVHKSNMNKLDEEGNPIYRKDGKVLKPEGWTPPNLMPILSRRFHLFNDKNSTFSESLKEINKAEANRWVQQVDSAVKSKLKWYDRILVSIYTMLEKSVNKRISVVNDVDNCYRKVAKITAYGDTTEITDY